MKNLSSTVFGWEENFKEILSKILKFQKNNDVEFVTIKFSPNGYLTLGEKSLSTILLGFNSEIIETQKKITTHQKK